MDADRAAAVITRLMRRFSTKCIARRRVRGRIATKIQRWWRRVRRLLPKTARQWQNSVVSFFVRDASARVVQAVWKGYVVRRPYKADAARRAARCIQACGRGFVARWWTAYLPQRQDAIRAADPGEDALPGARRLGPVMVPVGYRVPADRNELTLRLHGVRQRTREKAATLIQRRWRQASGLKQEDAHNRLMKRLWLLNTRAIVLQRWWRKILLVKDNDRRIREGGVATVTSAKSSGRRAGGHGASSQPTRAEIAAAKQKALAASQAVVRHKILATEREAAQGHMQDQLLSLWNQLTEPTIAQANKAGATSIDATTSGAASPSRGSVSRRSSRRLPPLDESRRSQRVGTSMSANAERSLPALSMRSESALSVAAPPPKRVVASTYMSRLMPERPQGRYVPITHNGKAVWNSATLLAAPTWFAEERDPALYRRATSSFL